MDGVGEVDGGSPGGQVDDVGVGGEDEDLVGKEVHLQGADVFLRVGVLLVLQQAADPGEGLLGAQLLVAHALLVLPVGGNAVFRHVVHVPGADLDLEGDALGADDRGVEGLVHVGLGGADIVLEPAQDGLIHVVDAAQDGVAGGDIVHDDPEGIEVEDLAESLVLGVHLAVDGINVLHAAVDSGLDALLLQAGGDLGLDLLHEGGVGLGLVVQLIVDLLVGDGIQVLQGEVFHLPLHALHTQAVGNGGVDLQGFQGFLPPLPLGLELHGADVVDTVADLDEHDADVLGHGHEHLAQILHLLFLDGGVLHLVQLGDALHQVGHRRGESLGHLFIGGVSILDGVVEQGGHDGVRVQTQLGHQMGHLQGVGDVGGAVLAQLSLVVGLGILIGVPDPGKVLLAHVFQFVFQLLESSVQFVLHIPASFHTVGCSLVMDVFQKIPAKRRRRSGAVTP